MTRSTVDGGIEAPAGAAAHDGGLEAQLLRRRTTRPRCRRAPAIELTETALEALLFVAERPLARREIATLAGTDRSTVDARLGDLEVSLAGTRHPPGHRWRSSRARDGARWRLARRPVRRRRFGPAVARLARDAGHRRVPPARHEVRRRADPRRRLRLHDPDAPPPPADRGAGTLRRARPAVSSTGPASTSSSASV